jgi:transglutaminase-like putative cysteine protease
LTSARARPTVLLTWVDLTMAIRVALTHRTRYRYPKPVWLSPHVLRLRPAPHCRTPILSYSLKVTPGDHFVNWQQDPYSNRLARLVFPKKTREFAVEVDLVAELTVINPFDFFLEKYAGGVPVRVRPHAQAGAGPVPGA